MKRNHNFLQRSSDPEILQSQHHHHQSHNNNISNLNSLFIRSTSASSLGNYSIDSNTTTSTTTTNNTTTTTTTTDSGSMYASLKRFKISTSPGELRLAKDVEELLKEYNWRPVSSAMFHNMNEFPHHQQQQTSYFSSATNSASCYISPDNKICLERDPSDPLRLRIVVLSSSTKTANTYHTHMNEKWEFLLQIPRLYPHAPPCIYRFTITRPNLTTSSFYHNSVSPSPQSCFLQSIVISSGIQHRQQEKPQSMLFGDYSNKNKKRASFTISKTSAVFPPGNTNITTSSNWNISPDNTFNYQNSNTCAVSDGNISNCGFIANYEDWTPISRLVDLIYSLADLPNVFYSTVAIEEKEQHQLYRNELENERMVIGDEYQQENDNPNNNMMMKTIRNPTNSNNYHHGKKHEKGTFFQPNRFDIGFPKLDYCGSGGSRRKSGSEMLVD